MTEKCIIKKNDAILNLDATRKDILAIALLTDSPVGVSVASRMTTLTQDESGNPVRLPNQARVDFVTAFLQAGNPEDVFSVTFQGTQAGEAKITEVSMTRRAIAERLLIASRFEELKPLSRKVTVAGKEVKETKQASTETTLSVDDLA